MSITLERTVCKANLFLSFFGFIIIHKEYDLVTLKDNKNLFPPYQGAPLFKKKLLQKHPELKKILNRLAGKITESQMSDMNYQVKVKGKSAKTVAHHYLKKTGLLK